MIAKVFFANNSSSESPAVNQLVDWVIVFFIVSFLLFVCD